MADLKAFADQLVNLTVKEVNELAQILKDEYGIEPAAAAVAVAPKKIRRGYLCDNLELGFRLAIFLASLSCSRRSFRPIGFRLSMTGKYTLIPIEYQADG